MSVNDFRQLLEHEGHKIVCVGYRKDGLMSNPVVNVAVECETCGTVLMDFTRPDIIDVLNGEGVRKMKCEYPVETCEEEARYTVKVAPPQGDLSVIRLCEKHKEMIKAEIAEEENGLFEVIY